MPTYTCIILSFDKYSATNKYNMTCNFIAVIIQNPAIVQLQPIWNLELKVHRIMGKE